MNGRCIFRLLLAAGAASTAFFMLTRPRPQRRSLGDAELVGNEVSGVYHRPGCRLFEAGETSPVFVSAAEAAELGYRPCGVCKPQG